MIVLNSLMIQSTKRLYTAVCRKMAVDNRDSFSPCQFTTDYECIRKGLMVCHNEPYGVE